MGEKHKYKPGSICEECSARHEGICGALSSDQLESLRKHSRRHAVEPGASLTATNDGNDSASVILSGAVKLLKMLPDGRQQIVGIQYAPDFVGRPYLKDTDVMAEPVTEASLCTFRRSDIEALIARSPELEHRLYLQALAELDDARELLLTLGKRTARERVAAFLLFVVGHSKPPEAANSAKPSLRLLLSRSEIGDFLGLTIETVSRQLHQLERAGIVKLERNRSISIIDTDRLRAEAGDPGVD